jgi:uncharacterized protein (DUF952 family)
MYEGRVHKQTSQNRLSSPNVLFPHTYVNLAYFGWSVYVLFPHTYVNLADFGFSVYVLFPHTYVNFRLSSLMYEGRLHK